MRETDPPRRGQHHKRLAGFTAAALGIAAIAGFSGLLFPAPETLWHRLTGPEIDGGWRFVSIDGRDVRRNDYSVSILWGRIVAGHDGCNGWGFQDNKPAGSHDREIVSTLVGCPDDPARGAYARFAFGAPEFALTSENRLALTLPGHRAKLVRID